MSFSLELPSVKSNQDGWGPIGKLEKFNDIPYAPFSKGDKIGKCSDWNSSARSYATKNYGANAFNPFTFKLEEGEDNFQMVDYVRFSAKIKNKNRNYQRQYFQQNKRNYSNQQGGQGQGSGRGGRGGRGGQRGYNAGYRNWNDRRQRNRESSIEVDSNWELKGEFDLGTFKQIQVDDLPDQETIGTFGQVRYYNRQYDKIISKDEKKLVKSDKIFPSIPTTDDKVIRKEYTHGNVYATDNILATLMTAHRSIYSWDIVVQKVGGKLFFELRPGVTEYLTVNEHLNVHQDDKDPINSIPALSLEATTINQNYWQQVVQSDQEAYQLENPMPEYEDYDNTVTMGYKYKKWDLGDDIVVLSRSELDAVVEDKNKEIKFVSVKAVNEHESYRYGIDFRKKIDSQRAAILATEMKNNSTKFAKWGIQATLAGCDLINLGFVCRDSIRDNVNHIVLATEFYPVSDIMKQNAIDMRNAWGVLKTIIQHCMKLSNGKYLLHRDPNRNVVNLYSVPENAFDQEDEEIQEEEDDNQDKGWVDESRE